MNRQQISQFAQGLLDEAPATGNQDPFLFNRFIDQACNELARATDSFYVQFSASLNAGQQSYCAPPLYQIKTVSCTIADGSTRILRSATPSQLDSIFPNWRSDPGNGNNPATGNPSWYVPQGLNQILVAPYPNYSQGSGATATATVSGGILTGLTATAGGSGYLNPPTVLFSGGGGSNAAATAILKKGVVTGFTITDVGSGFTSPPTVSLVTYGLNFEGFAVPEDGDQNVWPNPTDECPLPTRAHEAVAFRAAIFRCIQNPTPENQARKIDLKQEYQKAKNYLEAEAALYTPATQFRDSASHFHGGHRWNWGGY